MVIHCDDVGNILHADTRVERQQPRASALFIQMHGHKEENPLVVERLVKKVRDSDMCATDANIYLNICYAGLPGNLGPALLKASKDDKVWASTGEVQWGVTNRDS